jgi:hypothetical protein
MARSDSGDRPIPRVRALLQCFRFNRAAPNFRSAPTEPLVAGKGGSSRSQSFFVRRYLTQSATTARKYLLTGKKAVTAVLPVLARG